MVCCFRIHNPTGDSCGVRWLCGIFSDVLRQAHRIYLGYNPVKKKVYIVGRKYTTAAREKQSLKNLGCTIGVSLDGWSSFKMK